MELLKADVAFSKTDFDSRLSKSLCTGSCFPARESSLTEKTPNLIHCCKDW